jgi:hypothetical protein
MSVPSVHRLGLLAKFWRSLKERFVGDAPIELEVCEYECRKPQCLQGEWEHCQRRLNFIELTKTLPQESDNRQQSVVAEDRSNRA